MQNPKLAYRYANALYEFSLEIDIVENVYNDILYIQKVEIENDELRKVLESPIIPQDKKQNIIREIFQKKLTRTVFNFFTLIVKKRREPELLMICRQFIKIYYKNHNIKEAYLTSAQPLSEKMVHHIKTYLEEELPYTFIIHLSVEPKIIGGIIVKIDDYFFDAGILNKINKLKAEFSQNKYAVGF
ncbi:MAG: ATP synthase F1 subunit delta [Bacteroidales bacterium]|jgi:F-type H+-transporting ATPase subunit delta|nr:ATP synthase F1 subunit delta [Bacteroidales bacterium]